MVRPQRIFTFCHDVGHQSGSRLCAAKSSLSFGEKMLSCERYRVIRAAATFVFLNDHSKFVPRLAKTTKVVQYPSVVVPGGQSDRMLGAEVLGALVSNCRMLLVATSSAAASVSSSPR